MADVQALAGRVRELDERVELLLVAAVFRLEAVRFVPDALPLLFYLLMIVLKRNFPLKIMENEEWKMGNQGRLSFPHVPFPFLIFMR